jgi:hypothetical protein
MGQFWPREATNAGRVWSRLGCATGGVIKMVRGRAGLCGG